MAKASPRASKAQVSKSTPSSKQDLKRKAGSPKASKSAKGKTALLLAKERAKARAGELPPLSQSLTPREMEQVLTVGQGRGVTGEGSLRGKLQVKDQLPFLHVAGRDKRELVFLLQGPEQEVLPAYVDHKVSVTGLIRKNTSHSGLIEVRKYSAKKVETEVAAPADEKLKFLSPGEIEQASSAGMGSGMKGFASIRGTLEMTGEEFFLVLSGSGTRQQVSFILDSKATKGIRKLVGHTVVVTGVVEKTSGWGGKLSAENCEPRANTQRISRSELQVVTVPDLTRRGATAMVEVKLNHGLAVSLPEKPGYTWAVEPTIAKRIGLREANFEPSPGDGAGTREFFFTPRNPGSLEVEFFLAKAFNPSQVLKSCKLTVSVKP